MSKSPKTKVLTVVMQEINDILWNVGIQASTTTEVDALLDQTDFTVLSEVRDMLLVAIHKTPPTKIPAFDDRLSRLDFEFKLSILFGRDVLDRSVNGLNTDGAEMSLYYNKDDAEQMNVVANWHNGRGQIFAQYQ